MKISIKCVYILHFFCISLFSATSVTEIENDGLIKALDSFIASKGCKHQIDPKNYTLIEETTENCDNQWPSARILERDNVTRIILIWRATKVYEESAEHPKFFFYGSFQPMVKTSLKLIQNSMDDTLNNGTPVQKKIEEIDEEDIEMLQYKLFPFMDFLQK